MTLPGYTGAAVLYYYTYHTYTAAHEASSFQQLLLILWLIHYIKRDLEIMFVHRPSGGPSLLEMVGEWIYYWGFGYWCGIGVNSPSFVQKVEGPAVYVLVVLMLLAIIGNGIAHIQLRNLRPPGTKVRAYTSAGLFAYISCPHYFCEIMTWVAFAALTQVVGAYVFVTATALILSMWATERHNKYVAEFPAYPKDRRVLFPFIY